MSPFIRKLFRHKVLFIINAFFLDNYVRLKETQFRENERGFIRYYRETRSFVYFDFFDRLVKVICYSSRRSFGKVSRETAPVARSVIVNARGAFAAIGDDEIFISVVVSGFYYTFLQSVRPAVGCSREGDSAELVVINWRAVGLVIPPEREKFLIGEIESRDVLYIERRNLGHRHILNIKSVFRNDFHSVKLGKRKSCDCVILGGKRDFVVSASNRSFAFIAYSDIFITFGNYDFGKSVRSDIL